MNGPEPHVLRWEPPTTGAHPIIEELRSRPGQWAVIWEEGTPGRPVDDENGAPEACGMDARVETFVVTGWHDGRMVRVHARWKPKPRAQFIPYSDHERQMAYGTGL